MKRTIQILIISLFCTVAAAQSQNQYPPLDDSAVSELKEYRQGNAYQRDAMLFMRMLADTHPYYILKERRDSLMALEAQVLEACADCSSDKDFTAILYGVLGKLHDKHTDVIDLSSMAEMRELSRQKKESGAYGNPGEVMAYGGDLFHYMVFPEYSICYLQFNQCADARTTGDESLPRWDIMLDEMFAEMKEKNIITLVVDAQYNPGGSSMLCDELLIRLRPLQDIESYKSYIRFSDLMGTFNPRIVTAKKAWEEEGHIDELYPMPTGNVPSDFVNPEVFRGNVIFVQGEKTYSSAGILMTLARDNRIGEIVGTTSTYSPSHYGEILPYSLPNTGELGSVCTKFFARPDSRHVDDQVLEPNLHIDLSDKEAAWQTIVNLYGIRDVKHPEVCNEEFVELMEVIARLADNSIFNDNYAPRYQADIDARFDAFREHPAVMWIAEHEWSKPWISYEAVPWLGAHAELVGDEFRLMPNCDPTYTRWPQKYVKEFLPLMSDFYRQTDFHQFYHDHSQMYSDAVEVFRRSAASYIDLDWFSDFFGSHSSHKAVTYDPELGFRVIVALNNGGGNFGIRRQKPGQQKEAMSVMLYAERKNGTPSYHINGDEVLLLVHEFCHSFLTSPKSCRKVGSRLLAENREKLNSVGYGIWQNVIEESLVRMSVIRYMLDHGYSEEQIRGQIDSEHDFYGFTWLPDDIEWYRGEILDFFEQAEATF